MFPSTTIPASVDGSAMDFFEQQEHARRQTTLLLAYFAAAVVVIVGQVFVRGSNRPAQPGESILDSDASLTRLPLILAGYLLLAAGSIGLPFVRLIKSAICREHEWLADADAVQFTRYPAGIAGALKKIGGLHKQGHLDTPHAETASHLYFANYSFRPWFGFLSTHPPMAKRIEAIEPAFDDQFPQGQGAAADGQVLVREAELLRAIADTLGCPVPPFVEALESQRSLQ